MNDYDASVVRLTNEHETMNYLNEFRPRRLFYLAGKRYRRTLKYWAQRVRGNHQVNKTPVFVLGCQRSGTDMTIGVLEQSPATWTYNEANPRAFRQNRLRDDAVIHRLIDNSDAPVVVFKSICDSHLANRILRGFETARIVWVYRHYADTANSTVRKWDGRQKEVLGRILRQEKLTHATWIAEHLNDEDIALIEQLYRPDMLPEEAAALFWYFRTKLYFDLRLHKQPQVSLAKYEDMVTQPTQSFGELFRFLGLPFDPTCVAGVSSSSVRKQPFPEVASQIKAICDELLERVDAQYRQEMAARIGSR